MRVAINLVEYILHHAESSLQQHQIAEPSFFTIACTELSYISFFVEFQSQQKLRIEIFEELIVFV